jgi:tetrahydromethanopterin S-methyltransferase subunit G
MAENNGMTSKELIVLVLDGQERINDRIDELHEKVNNKVSKSEFFGYIGIIISFAVLLKGAM